jgi:7,8-dihydropterin-6-yl-methyl-4-(beta-D-ribofuranosyl)aminobenzene 5'-phosphate synthase
VRDSFDHELVMVVKDDAGMVVFTGCSHSGVLNMVDAARDAFPGTPVSAVVGGFHLIGLPWFNSMAVSRAEVAALAGELADRCDGPIITGHCTGQKGTEALRAVLGDQLQTFQTGSQVVI